MTVFATRLVVRPLLAVAVAAAAWGAVGCNTGDDSTGRIGVGPGTSDASVADGGAGADGSSDAGAHDGSSDGNSSGDDGASAEGATDATADSADGSGSGADTGADTGDGGGFPPPPGPLCNTTPSWGAGVLLSISTSADDELDSVTPDELSIAWTSGTGSSAVVEYADRASTSDPFGTPQTLAAGQFTTDRVALSQDGLRLVVVNADGQGFSELTRTSRLPPGNTFGAAGVGTYSNLDAAGELASGQSYGDPVLSADDHAFYYSVYGAGLTTTVYRTERLFPNDAWPAGAPVAAAAGLAAQGSLRRRPTGISSDEQTLFFWDEVMGMERAAWIDESTGSFDIFANLGTQSMAAPNTACTELYFSSMGTSSVDLFSASD
jgi:hypothetical protein